VAAIGVVGIAGLGSPARAQSQEIATLEAVRGGVTVIRLGLSQAPTTSMPLQMNDIVVTKQGRATVRFHSDGSVLRIGPDSRVQINESATDRDVTVFFGRLWAHVVRAQERVSRFRSGSTIAAIRGTEVSLGVAADGDETQLSVLEGQVEAETDAGRLMLTGGQSAVGRRGTAPTLGVRVRPQDAVQWALYYVPVISPKPGELGEGPWQARVRESTEAYAKGDLQGAIDGLASVDVQAVRDPRFFTYRASLLLATGSVEAANQDIERALGLSANDSAALALQTIIAVAMNDTDKALATGQRAVAANASSATAHIALSYARQAAFDLEGARASLETAVQQDPNDALAWARLAEIRSSQGYLDEALEAAQKAVELEPNLSRTQTVLGFAYLTRVQTREAKEAFQKAIALDQDDPLPRLGMGLAQIREGDLEEGSQDIEVAVSLDPAASVVRSYLGKAYFEAKRAGLDTREYDLAKESDPNDPTPWFYDAITKQTTNRPVEALEDLQGAIERNDNRAVYRSRLLLDADLASRSASLGRIYGDLGFQNLALVEGWNSVNTDPSNYSAHRLLADSYAALPRHEIARVSELFQSQMLQPLNTTPIQPRLGESNLLLISAGGPGSLSFNEFNPLFNRDGVRGQGNFLFGEDDTLSGEGIVSGIFKKFSFSAGYSGFKTDGFRENADQEDHIANVFAQMELSPSTSVQAEYRYRDNERGDLTLRFFPDDYHPGERNTEERHTGRVGVRHAFSPGSVLLGSLTYQDAQASFTNEAPGEFIPFIGAERPESALGTEVQHLFRSRRINLTTGLGYFDIDGRIDQTIAFDPIFVPPPDNVLESTVSTDLNHLNVYAYSHIKPVEQFTVIAGASADFLSGDSPDVGEQDQFNPKFGAIWKPIPSTTLRAAVFRVMKRTLITDQTLEPTQVAGFNQFYDDFNGTRAWRYGGAIDQKFTKSSFGGAEFAKRDLDIRFLVEEETGQTVETEEASERLARAYFLATPHPWLALRAEYVFERFESEGLSLVFPKKLDTHRVPLGMGFFHPSGFGASLTATYFNQEGAFVRFGEFQSGSDEFWTVDVSVNYRLPQRFGFLSVGATNLLDEEFNFFDIDLQNPIIQPTRRIYARVTLAF
jgi:tetratricopeptide (TPR) repeat protein